jgi:nucleoside phosphorylase
LTLLYFALGAEAQIFIEKLKAKKISSNPKIFLSNRYVLAIGGVGKGRLESTLQRVFEEFSISKCVNIGIAGVNSSDILVGRLFCVYPKMEIALITKDIPTTKTDVKKETLFDMEGKYFYDFCKDRVDEVYIFKVVSDHLDSKILSKEFVKKLIHKNFNSIIKEIE